jgi:hypothetical protein
MRNLRFMMLALVMLVGQACTVKAETHLQYFQNRASVTPAASDQVIILKDGATKRATVGSLPVSTATATAIAKPEALTRTAFGNHSTPFKTLQYAINYGAHQRTGLQAVNNAENYACTSCHAGSTPTDPYYVMMGSTFGRSSQIPVDRQRVKGAAYASEEELYQLAVTDFQSRVIAAGVALTAGDNAVICASDTRGHLYMTQGGAGAKDVLKVCAKDNADTYAWRTLY